MSALGARTDVFDIRTRIAIELEVFTHIAARETTSDAIAPLRDRTEKGVRVLCDYLTVHGFLTKAKEAYGLAPDTAASARQESPSYMGFVADVAALATAAHRSRTRAK